MIDVRSVHAIVGGEISGQTVLYPSPGHSARDRGMSATVDPAAPGGLLVHSFNGGDALAEKDRIMAALGVDRTRPEAWRETGHYEYRDVDGTLLYRTVRLEKPGEKKRFTAQRPDGAGGWINGIGERERIPYRLADLAMTGPDTPILFAEGERKADKLASMGHVATSIAFGCKGWRSEYAEHFRGRTVIILPDNDDEGRTFAAKVKAEVAGVGGRGVILELPGLPHRGDIIDWTGTAGDLQKLIVAALEAKPAPSREPAYMRGISAAALMAKQFAPVRFIATGLLAEGATLFGGKPKLGKSWLALQIGCSVASGQPLFGSIPVDAGDVIYLALEDSERRLRSRLVKQGRTPPERLTLATEWPTLDGDCMAELEAWADAVERPVLVIVDVLKMVRGSARANESLYDADYRALAGLRNFAQSRSIAVLVVHHVRKMDADDPLESLSGTNGLTGAADTVMVLKRDMGTGHCILYVRGRDVEESEKAVRFKPDNGTWEMLGDAADVGRTNERQAILDILRQHANPLTVREISDMLDRNYEATRKCLARMWKAGEVQKEGRGSYTCPMCPNVPNDSQPDNRTHRTGYNVEDESDAAFVSSIPRASWLTEPPGTIGEPVF